VIHRAIEDSRLTQKFVDDIFGKFRGPGAPMATVLVAENGKVYVNSSYNVPPNPRYMPETTLPNFDIGNISDAFNAVVALAVMRTGKMSLDDALNPGGPTVRTYLAHQASTPDAGSNFARLVSRKNGGAYAQLVTQRVFTPVGMHRTTVDSSTARFRSNVDELYRLELGLTYTKAMTEEGTTSIFTPVGGGASGAALGWTVDTFNGTTRQSAFATPDGKRAAFVRFPERKATIIILTNDPAADARGMADRIASRLLRN
jgi:CubicO group peptidase (beta-lactamase class C family)